MKAALFDLDGVILDTEAQYSKFWGSQCHLYFPERQGLENIIKGQTLTQIFSTLFAEMQDQQPVIKQRLDAFEQQMQYNYIPGVPAFIADLKRQGVLTAIVTSSNDAKMANVYRAHPELRQRFDQIVTAEHCTRSKPDPECYLKGAQLLGVEPNDCVGFEDSINGLKAVRNADMKVVGLATTNPRDIIAPLADIVIDNFQALTVTQLTDAGF
ncbi:MAG: HAD family phosphatase [Prevotella sp.]|nr:HAD family phosphatase [Prevotella sp.]